MAPLTVTMFMMMIELICQQSKPQAVFLTPRSMKMDTIVKYESYMVHLVNQTDSLMIIERIATSCGCLLATVQRNIANKREDGLIYIAVTTQRLDSL